LQYPTPFSLNPEWQGVGITPLNSYELIMVGVIKAVLGCFGHPFCVSKANEIQNG
jgi:hypothetical protein